MAYSFEKSPQEGSEQSLSGQESFAESKALHDRIADESALTTVVSAVPLPLVILSETRQVCFANDSALTLSDEETQEGALGLGFSEFLSNKLTLQGHEAGEEGDWNNLPAIAAAIEGVATTEKDTLIVEPQATEAPRYTIRGIPLPIDNRTLALLIMEPA